MTNIVRIPLCSIATALVTLLASAGLAQDWPARPVTVIVPFTAGTTSDVVARALVDHLTHSLGRPFVIDNRGGAGGNIGAAMAAKAKPDGYTLLLATTGPAATNKLMYKDLSFDPQRDFAPVILLGKSPVIIVARADLSANSLNELIVLAKANPDKLTAGFPGNGTLGHVTGELLQQRAGITFSHTQYRGSAPIMTDLLGGHIDIAMDSTAAYVPNVKAGKLKALAIAAASRWSGLPDVPTVAEAMPGFEASVWYALLAPANTPQDIIAKLNGATNTFLGSQQTKDMFHDLGIVASGGSPEEASSFIAAEIQKWAPIIKAANITF